MKSQFNCFGLIFVTGATVTVFFVFNCCLLMPIFTADIVIRIPEYLRNEVNCFYRFDYYPPIGDPKSNTTIPSTDVEDAILFSNLLAGTKYNFSFFYTNSSHHDVLAFPVSMTIAPDPPSNSSFDAFCSKTALISWSPPSLGNYSSFKLKIIGLSDATTRLITIADGSLQYQMQDLMPGATYQVQIYTVFDNQESIPYTSRNFTTQPNTPRKLILWYSDETILWIKWLAPNPTGIYTHYIVSIEPPDIGDSVLYVEKNDEPEAEFKGLVPGRTYNITVQTMSQNKISLPITAQYRATNPRWPMSDVTAVPKIKDTLLKPLPVLNLSSFTNNKTGLISLVWKPAADMAISTQEEYKITFQEIEAFSYYTIQLFTNKTSFILDTLKPGRNYSVTVQVLLSKKQESDGKTIFVITRPSSPIIKVLKSIKEGLVISWISDVNSRQKKYLIEFSRNQTNDSKTIVTNKTKLVISNLYPGAGYEVKVLASSHGLYRISTRRYSTQSNYIPLVNRIK